MKKRFILFMLLLSFPFMVKAASASISVPSSVGENKSFTISVNLASTASWNIKISASGNVNSCSKTFVDVTSDGKNTSKTLSVTCKAKSKGTIKITATGDITDASGTTKDISLTKSITVKALDTNTNLSSLTVSNCTLSPSFSASTTSYTCSNTDASSLKISATPSSSSSKVANTGTKNLELGTNTFNIVVTAESGAKKTYTIKVTRNDTRDGDATISSFQIEGVTFEFNSNTYEYNLEVPNEIEQFIPTATATSSKTTINGLEEEYLKVGDNKIEITTKAENGTTLTYTFNINRAERETTTKECPTEETSSTKDTTISPVITGIVGLLMGSIIGIAISLILKKKKNVV